MNDRHDAFVGVQTSQDGFYACLDIWSIFVDYLKAKDESRLMNKDNSLDKYVDTNSFVMR